MDDCWTLFCLQIVARVVSAPERLSLSSNKSEQTGLEAALLTRLRGFSRIVDALIAVRIPIVGHNCLMDLLLIYQGNASDSQSNYLRKFFCGPVMYGDNFLIKCGCNLVFQFWEKRVLLPPQQFVADLPESYEKAKAAIHSAFPSVYDTKFMTFELRKLLDKNDLYKWAGLSTPVLPTYEIRSQPFSFIFRSTGIH